MLNQIEQGITNLPLSSTKRLQSIDFLRGSAAVAVVLSHTISYGTYLPEAAWFVVLRNFLNYGSLGVPLFFVISGFCIHLRWTHQYSNGQGHRIDFVSFWKRRVRRLYPPYFIVLCLSMGLVFVAYLRGMNLILVTNYSEPRLLWIGVDFLLHATMLHGLFPYFDRTGGNQVFWTLAREEYFYLMYFGLLAWRWRWGTKSCTLIVCAVGIGFTALMHQILPSSPAWRMAIDSSAINLWIQWCLGMVAVEAHYKLVRVPFLFRVFWTVPVWTAIALFCGTAFPLLSPVLWGIVFFTLLNACLEKEVQGSWPNLSIVRWTTQIGIFSYSLYLIHLPVRGVVKQLLGTWADNTHPVFYLGVVMLMTIASILAGKLFFVLVEKRFLNPPLRPLDTPVVGTSSFANERSAKSL